jgi:hypothetical protein
MHSDHVVLSVTWPHEYLCEKDEENWYVVCDETFLFWLPHAAHQLVSRGWRRQLRVKVDKGSMKGSFTL